MKKTLIVFVAMIIGLLGNVTSYAAEEPQKDEEIRKRNELLAQTAEKLLNDYRTIAQAYVAYHEKFGKYPANFAALIAEKLLDPTPVPDCNVLPKCTPDTSYGISNWGDNDGNGMPDIVIDIVNGGSPDIDLCLAFNAQHTSLGGRAWKNKSLGNGVWEDFTPPSWPETDQTFCVCWANNCDKDPTGLVPGDINIITLLAH